MKTREGVVHGEHGILEVRLARDLALVDEPVGIVVSGCVPNAHVAIQASIDWAAEMYVATGRYRADARGRVDTALHPSHGGTYLGVDPFGLWWSGERRGPSSATPPLAPLTARVRVDAGSRSVESTIQRPWLAPGASLSVVHERGVQGLYARPAGNGPFPAVVAFGGSGGGLGPSGGWAALLASHGFATLAISYFGAAGLPAELVAIEVEVVERAIDWVLRKSETSGRVAVMGASRGSELALLAGSLLDHVDAVVAFAPSGVVWAGLGSRGPIDASAWTFRGQPLPYAMMHRPAIDDTDPQRPFDLRPMFERALLDHAMIAEAEIPVERIRGPVLMVSGGSDLMWPSTPMAEIAERRAARCNTIHRIEHLRYPDAGHVGIGAPGTPVVTDVHHPLDGQFYAFGGTRAANARARADSWPRVLDFLGDALVRR